MKHILCLLILFLAACKSTGSPDIGRLHQHVDAIEQTIGDFVLANSATDPEFSAQLAKLENAVHVLDERLAAAAAGGEVDLLGGIDLAITAAGDLAALAIDDPLKQSRVRTVAALVRGVLLQIRIEVAPQEEPGVPKP